MVRPIPDCIRFCQKPRKGAIPDPPANMATGTVVEDGGGNWIGLETPIKTELSLEVLLR
jgi:hypothetical protein